LDKEKTIKSIQDYVAGDFNTQPNKNDLLEIEETEEKYQKLSSETKNAYKDV
jgi:hypothetical protein